MDIKIIVTGAGLSEERVAGVIGELVRDIYLETDPCPRLVVCGSESSSALNPHEIALEIGPNGVVERLVERLFGFLDRNRKIELILQMPTGERTNIDADFVNRHGIDAARALSKDLTRLRKHIASRSL
jgi:hypothetical protein